MNSVSRIAACIFFVSRVKDYQSRQAVHELGGIPPILNLVTSDFPVIQHLALKTLQILTTDKDSCITFREVQGFEKLLDILNNAVRVIAILQKENA